MTMKNQLATVSELVGSSNLAGRDLVNQIVGQAQALQASSELLRTGAVSKHAMVKENKLYQQLAGVLNPHGAELKGTWEEYCSLLGRSVDMVDRDIANLQAFGEEALDAMIRAGIGYRDLKQFRRLPADQQSALIEAAKSGDKESFVDFAETLIAKHQREKEAASRSIDTLTDKVAMVQGKLNDQVEINQGLTKKRLKSDLRSDTQLVRDECLHQQALCDYGAQALLKQWNDVLDEDPSAPEHRLRREQVVIAARSAAAATAKVLHQIHESAGEDLPERVTTAHMLTPDEFEAWEMEWASLRGGLIAKDSARKGRLQEELPKGVGRPKGAKTGTGKAAKSKD
jgi:hypothetical protein